MLCDGGRRRRPFVARGGPARDVDVGLVVERAPRDWSAESEIVAEIASLVSLRPSDIDVRVLEGGDPVFLNNVLREGALVFERDHEARVRFEVGAMARWLDYQPVWERVRAAALERWSGE